MLRIFRESFPGHKGRPGHVGGSSSRRSGLSTAESTRANAVEDEYKRTGKLTGKNKTNAAQLATKLGYKWWESSSSAVTTAVKPPHTTPQTTPAAAPPPPVVKQTAPAAPAAAKSVGDDTTKLGSERVFTLQEARDRMGVKNGVYNFEDLDTGFVSSPSSIAEVHKRIQVHEILTDKVRPLNNTEDFWVAGLYDLKSGKMAIGTLSRANHSSLARSLMGTHKGSGDAGNTKAAIDAEGKLLDGAVHFYYMRHEGKTFVSFSTQYAGEAGNESGWIDEHKALVNVYKALKPLGKLGFDRSVKAEIGTSSTVYETSLSEAFQIRRKRQMLRIIGESFPNHAGRPGKQDGSVSRRASLTPSETKKADSVEDEYRRTGKLTGANKSAANALATKLGYKWWEEGEEKQETKPEPKAAPKKAETPKQSKQASPTEDKKQRVSYMKAQVEKRAKQLGYQNASWVDGGNGRIRFVVGGPRGGKAKAYNIYINKDGDIVDDKGNAPSGFRDIR